MPTEEVGLISDHIDYLCGSINRAVVRRRWKRAINRIMRYGMTREESIDLVLRMLRYRMMFIQDTELTLNIVENWK